MVTQVVRALTVLRLVAERADPTAPIAVGDLARGVDRDPSAVSRACTELERLGMLARSSRYGAYRLGPDAIALSGRAAAPTAQAVRYALTAAAQQTGETVLLAAPTPDGARIVDAVASSWTLHSPADVGDLVADPDGAVLRAADSDAAEVIETTLGRSTELATPVRTRRGDVVAVLGLRLPTTRSASGGARARRSLEQARRMLESAVDLATSAPRPPVAPPREHSTRLAATLDLLHHLAAGADTVVGAARATGLRSDRAQRLLADCRAAGYVAAGDPDGRVHLSWMTHGWYRAASAPTLIEHAREPVVASARTTGTCGFVTLLRGLRSVTVVEELAMGEPGLRVASWLGRAHPIVGSDGGPAMLVDFAPDEISRLFPSRNTPRELERLLAHTRRAARDGVLAMETYGEAGMSSMAAPIRDASGTVTGAACLVGTTDDMEARRDVLLAETRALADRISAVLGAPAS